MTPRGGFAVAELIPGPPCELCRGEGRRVVERHGIRRVGRCVCQRLPDRVALYNAAGVPAKHANCTLESFRVELARPTWVAVRRWTDSFEPGGGQSGLILAGEPGRGKTHLLAAVVRELVFRYGVAVKFVEFSHLLANIREGYDRKEGEARLLSPLVRAPVLAIDELGKGRGSDFETAVLDEIVSRRYNAQAGPLLATTNFPLRAPRARRESDSLSTMVLPTLSERLGERVWSRLKEACHLVEAAGDDYRITKGKA